MQKTYKNKEIKESQNRQLTPFFFPKANPPITIEAETLEEAEQKLEALKNNK